MKWLFIVIVVLLALFAAIVYWGSELADLLVEKIYANVERPNIGDTPPTFTTFPAGPAIVSVLGGKGEGLNCSIPSWAKFVFGDAAAVQAPHELRFRQACVMHDLCYRHGLATYGYTQGDCDYMLQEQMSQVCNMLGSSISSRQDCRTAAKKVLLGVRIGGAESYRDAEESTYFEYDPFPLHSIEFTYARSMSTPNQGKEALITFRSKHSGLSAAEAGEDPSRASAQGRTAVEAGDGLQPVWMPQGFYMAAPHHVVAPDGFSKLVWPMRFAAVKTNMCLVQRDHRELYNLPTPANGMFNCALSKVEGHPNIQTPIDLNSASPVVVSGPGAPLLVAGLTNLGVAKEPSPFGATLDLKNMDIDWTALGSEDAKNVYRFFQSSFTAGKFHGGGLGQDLLIFRRGRSGVAGAGYQDSSDAIVVPASDLFSDNDLKPTEPSAPPRKRKAKVLVELPISEPAEPVVRLASATGDDKLIGLARGALCEVDGYCFYAYGLNNEKPVRLPVEASSKAIAAIDASFVARPILVAGYRSGDRIELILTRVGGLANRCQNSGAKGESCEDSGILDVAVLALSRDPAKPALVFSRGASCTFAKKFGSRTPDPCRLPTNEQTRKRLTWANRLKGGQTIVGDFIESPELDVAFIDACNPAKPIILHGVAATPDRPATFDKPDGSPLDILECKPLEGSALASPPEVKNPAAP